MRKIFSYSVLRFRPSYLLEEQINVGLLFVFRGEQKITFLHPNNLERVRQFYPNADINILGKYLTSFEQKARNLSKHNHQLDNIFRTFIPKDASNLYLTVPKSGHYSDIDTTLDFYKKEYFSIYQTTPKKDWTTDAALIAVIGIITYLIIDYFNRENQPTSQVIKQDIKAKFHHLEDTEIDNIYASVEAEVGINENSYSATKRLNGDINAIMERVMTKLDKSA